MEWRLLPRLILCFTVRSRHPTNINNIKQIPSPKARATIGPWLLSVGLFTITFFGTSKSIVFTVVLGTLGVSDTEVEFFVTVFCVSTWSFTSLSSVFSVSIFSSSFPYLSSSSTANVLRWLINFFPSFSLQIF